MNRIGVAIWVCVVAAAPATAKNEERKRAKRAALKQAQEKAAQERRLRLLVEKLGQTDPRARYYAAWNLRSLLPASQQALLKVLRERTRKQTWAVVEAANVAGEARLTAAAKLLRACVRDGTTPLIGRVSAVLALAKLMTPDARAFLAKLAKDTEEPELLREAAALGLAVQGAPAAGDAAKALLELGPTARRAGLRALGMTGDRRHAARCLEGLQDTEAHVRSIAAIALGRLNDPQTRARLVQALPRVRDRTLSTLLLNALARMNHAPSTGVLLKQAQNRKHPGQLQAIATLTATRAPRAAAVFRAILPQALRGKHQAGVAEALCLAFAELRDVQAIPLLTRVLVRGTLPCRRAAARALGRLGAIKGVEPAQVVEPLQAALGRNSDRTLTFELLLALGSVGNFPVRRELKAALAHKEPVLRWAAIQALEGLEDPRQAPLLEPLTQDPEPFVQAAAKRALRHLRNDPVKSTDDRPAEALAELRALERELVLRAQHEERRLELALTMRNQQRWEYVDALADKTHVRIGGGGLPFGTEGAGGLPFNWKRSGKRFEGEAALAVSTELKEATEETYALRMLEGRGRRDSERRHRRTGRDRLTAKADAAAPTATPAREALVAFRDALLARTETIRAGDLQVSVTYVPNYDLYRAAQHLLDHADERDTTLRRQLKRLSKKRDRGLPGLLIRFRHPKASTDDFYASEGKPRSWARCGEGVRLSPIRTVGAPVRAKRYMLFQASKSAVYGDTNISATARRLLHVLPGAEETFGLDLRVRNLPRAAGRLEVTLRNLIHFSGAGVGANQVDFKQGATAAFQRFPRVKLALPVPTPTVPDRLARLVPRGVLPR